MRVTLAFAAVMAAVLGGTGLFLYLRLEAELNQTIDQNLRSRASEIIRQIRVYDSGLGESARSAIKARGETFAQVLTAHGRIFDPRVQHGGSPALERAQVEQADQGPVILERSGFPGLPNVSGAVRLLATPIRFEGRPLLVVAAESLASRDAALENLATLLLIGGPAALLLASLAAYWAAGAALRPVEAMRRRAAEISAAEANQRLPVPPSRDELRRLGETLNQMLDRVAAALARERAFVDDASHELRTPLATHIAELELALRYAESEQELRAAVASAIEDAARLSRLAEDLLVIARSDKGQLRVEARPVRVGDLFGAIHERLGGRIGEAGRSLVVEETNGLVVEADPLRIEQALANLVDNALRHGEGTIRIWAREDGGRAQLHVSDAGPGFPREFLPHAFERFRRADAARGDGGTGLGLAIVEAIAHAHQGQAAARNAPEGGADVWIELNIA